MMCPTGLKFKLNLILDDYVLVDNDCPDPHSTSSPAATSSTRIPPPWCTADAKGFARGNQHGPCHDQTAPGACCVHKEEGGVDLRRQLRQGCAARRDCRHLVASRLPGQPTSVDHLPRLLPVLYLVGQGCGASSTSCRRRTRQPHRISSPSRRSTPTATRPTRSTSTQGSSSIWPRPTRSASEGGGDEG